jgi:hypothetical protein
LEKARIGGGYAVSSKCVNVGGEVALRIEAVAADRFPNVFAKNLGVEFEIPEHLERFALGIIVETRCGNCRIGTLLDRLDEIRPRANPDDIAWLGKPWIGFPG